jgi:oligopeptidase B
MNPNLLWLVTMAAGLLAFPGTRAEDDGVLPKPPVAKKVPKVDVVHGDKRVDDYFWLREKGSPEVESYLEAENAYAQAMLKPIEGFVEPLYQEMLARIKQTDLSVPFREGTHYYFTRTEEGKQYPIRCRKKGSLEAPEQVLLDVNALAEGERFMSVAAFDVSDDENLLAYSTDNTGFRQYTLHVRDLRTGKDAAESIPKTTSVAWASDGKTLFYVVEDHAKRPYRLYRHVLGEPPEKDALVYEEKDERFNLGVSRSRSKAYLFLESESHTTSEVRFLPAGDPAGEFRLVAPRIAEQEYYVDHRGDLFYIRANDKGRNYRVVTAPVSDPRRENWKEFVAHRDDVMIAGLDAFSKHLVHFEREGGLPHLRVMDLEKGDSHRIAFEEPVYAVFPDANPEFDTTVFRFNYQSLTIPPSVYDYDLVSKERKLLKREEVLGDFDPENYRSERIFAEAADGTRIPVSLVYRKGIERDGKSPIYLTGYGSYGSATPTTFSSSRLSLLDRGVVCAIAHIRGGGEMGKRWHDDGRMMKKKNTFTDFIACADHLVAQKYGARERLVIQGGSAGGLLMGAVLNLRPDLCKAAVVLVPFVDVINTMLDDDLPLTVGEFEEWGNPKVKEQYDYMKTYCPYTNLEAKAYPAMLVRTSYNDSQVMYWEPAKYVAKLRSLKTDSNPLIFRTNMAAGHGGSSGRYDRLRETALDYAFVLWQGGITK